MYGIVLVCNLPVWVLPLHCYTSTLYLYSNFVPVQSAFVTGLLPVVVLPFFCAYCRYTVAVKKKFPFRFRTTIVLWFYRLRSVPVLSSCESIVGTVWNDNRCSIVLTRAATRLKV